MVNFGASLANFARNLQAPRVVSKRADRFKLLAAASAHCPHENCEECKITQEICAAEARRP